MSWELEIYLQVQQEVVSLGPYPLYIFAFVNCETLSKNLGSRTSPPNWIAFKCFKQADVVLFESNKSILEEVISINSHFSLLINLLIGIGFLDCSSLANISFLPDNRAIQTSAANISNATEQILKKWESESVCIEYL